MKTDVMGLSEDPAGTVAVAELEQILKDGDLKQVKSLLPSEVGAIFGVCAKTVATWVNRGRMSSRSYFTTCGGHKRYYEAYVHFMLAQCGVTDKDERQMYIDRCRSNSEVDDTLRPHMTRIPHRFA